MKVVLLLVLAYSAYTLADADTSKCEQSVSKAKYYSHGDTCFALRTDSRDYPTAKKTCEEDHKGTLVMPKTRVVQDFLNYILSDQGIKSPVWIGLTDQDKEGLFVWVDGESLGTGDYHRWAKGQEPGHDALKIKLGNLEDCVAITDDDHHTNYHWHDYICTAPLGLAKKNFICQFDATN